MRRCEYLKKEVKKSSFKSYSNTIKKKSPVLRDGEPFRGSEGTLFTKQEIPFNVIGSYVLALDSYLPPPPLEITVVQPPTLKFCSTIPVSISRSDSCTSL